MNLFERRQSNTHKDTHEENINEEKEELLVDEKLEEEEGEWGPKIDPEEAKKARELLGKQIEKFSSSKKETKEWKEEEIAKLVKEVEEKLDNKEGK